MNTSLDWLYRGESSDIQNNQRECWVVVQAANLLRDLYKVTDEKLVGVHEYEIDFHAKKKTGETISMPVWITAKIEKAELNGREIFRGNILDIAT